MWRSGKDPDSFSIPYLTALGDLLGTALLALSFHFLWVIGDQDSDVGDWVTVVVSAVTGTMLFCHTTSHTHSLVGMWVLYVAGQHIPPLHFTLAVWELFSVPGFFSEYKQKTLYSVFLDCSHCLHQSTCVMKLVSWGGVWGVGKQDWLPKNVAEVVAVGKEASAGGRLLRTKVKFAVDMVGIYHPTCYPVCCPPEVLLHCFAQSGQGSRHHCGGEIVHGAHLGPLDIKHQTTSQKGLQFC